jgi:hypothetical protein
MTIQDLLKVHCEMCCVVGNFNEVSRHFYAGAAAMAQQFATHGILYLPGAGDSHAVGGPARDTPWSDEALKTVGGEVQGEVQL